MADYDLAIIGGGLGGATLGLAMAQSGARVVIIEREAQFRDRVRGEGIFPWGCVEAKALGIYDALRDSCAHEVRYWTGHADPTHSTTRDFHATTPSGLGMLNFHHERMQQTIAQRAAAAGAAFRRPADAIRVTQDATPCVTFRTAGGEETLSARLVVGADGRASRVRGWAGFAVRRDPACLMVASTLHEGLQIRDDSVHVAFNPHLAQTILVYPLGARQFRTYLIHRSADRTHKFSGDRDAQSFIAACRETGGPDGWFDRARQIGLLASFDAASSWVVHPARDGVALIGDAAGASDPAYGCGLSLTLRDVRVLRDQLRADADWHRAAEKYAADHDQYFDAMKRIIDWRTEMNHSTGPAADARRAHAGPLIRQDPSRAPDMHGLGPEAPSDDDARRRYFGEV